MGAEVVLAGDSYSEAKAHCDGLVAETGLAFVHPFDDPLVIAGQGTIGEEILRQCHGRMDAVFVPVGGGGLIAGVAGYLKAVMPGVKVIGVEPFEADAMYRSLEAGKRVHLDRVGIFADGVAVREVGEETFRIARECVDGVVRVTNDEICAAIKDVFDETRSVMEPAGALAVAGLKAWAARDGKGGERLVAILSGANMNFDRLRFVSERAEVGEAREALLGGHDSRAAGGVPRVLRRDRAPGRHRVQLPPGGPRRRPHLRGPEDRLARGRPGGGRRASRARLRSARPHRRRDGQAPRPLHGGRAARSCATSGSTASSSPSGPGALMEFLETLGGRWNISLFHYRNHGADFGRVLAAFEVPRRGARRAAGLPRPPRLSRGPRDRQPGLLALPGRQRLLIPDPRGARVDLAFREGPGESRPPTSAGAARPSQRSLARARFKISPDLSKAEPTNRQILLDNKESKAYFDGGEVNDGSRSSTQAAG